MAASCPLQPYANPQQFNSNKNSNNINSNNSNNNINCGKHGSSQTRCVRCRSNSFDYNNNSISHDRV